METKNKERCTCGQTAPVYYPDENQWEPGCWECYYQSREVDESSEIDIEPVNAEDLAIPEEVLLMEAEEQELRDAEERHQEELADMWININKDAYPNG